MGRSRNGNKKRNMNKNRNQNNKNNGAGSYDPVIKENKFFEAYYKQLNIIDNDDEWNVFMDTLKQPLPIVFRITRYKSYSNEILNILKEKHFKYLTNSSSSSSTSSNEPQSHNNTNNDEIYKCLNWYPNEIAWQVNLTRQDVRKNEKFLEFKQFLIDQTEHGYLNRQEAVSMLPPLFLDIKSHHKILDMCAAPGSKTAQLIEQLHADKSNPIPDGFVVANDIDNKRCYMLVHQLKRLESPNLMIINHDSTTLPNMRYQTTNGELKSLLYDRILCDVPCSGDGTFRKNIDIWAKWNDAHACNLHGIQTRIARRGIDLLEQDGLMVYSTCSLNPVENEAVIYNLLLEYKDKIELVDLTDKLNGLKVHNGLYKWNIMSKDGHIYDSLEQVDTKYQYLIRSHMFPPSLEVAKQLNLERCIRILPHYQNTGGFFIAVIRKLKKTTQLTVKVEQNDENVQTSDVKVDQPPEPKGTGMKAPPAKRLKHVYEENPFVFYDNEKPLDNWSIIKEFFGITDDFPIEQLMTRNRKDENIRNVYFVSKEIADLAKLNGDRIKFINMGVKFLSKAEIKDITNIELRVCQESVDIAQKYFEKRIFNINNKNDTIKLLTESIADINSFSESFQNDLQAYRNACGSIIINNYIDNDTNNKLQISFVAWLGKTTIRPFINIQTRSFYLELCGIDKTQIADACAKIKLEDQINSEKSKLKNPNCLKTNDIEDENKASKSETNNINEDGDKNENNDLDDANDNVIDDN